MAAKKHKPEVEPEVEGDPETGPTCVYKAGTSKIVKGLDVQAAYNGGWYDVPTDHPDSRE